MSTVQGGPSGIVTNGLMLWLDASYPQSYPGFGTSWNDLTSNGNNGTLINGPTYSSANGGSIVFDGVDDYVKIGSSTPSYLLGNPAFSVCGWFKRSGDFSNGSTWGIGGGDPNLGQGINSWTSGATNQICLDLWGTSTYSTGQTYSLTEWKHVVWIYKGSSFITSNVEIFVNTISYTGSGLTVLRGGSGTPNINANGISLGRASDAQNAYYGKPIISNFLIYNKILSPSEVLQNYNATKTRFGL